MYIQLPQQDTSPSPSFAHPVHLLLCHPFDQACDLAQNNWEASACALDKFCPSSPSTIPSLPPSPSSSGASTPESDANSPRLDSEQDLPSLTRQNNRMPKRRTSLQAILIPPFLSYPLSNNTSEPRSSTRVRSPSTSSQLHAPPLSVQSPEAVSLELSRSSPPPDFLLDDDPFANHTGARPLPLHHSNTTPPTHSRKTSVKQPRSPLATEPRALASLSQSSSTPVPVPCSRSASSPSRPPPPSPLLSGRQVRPAYTRPAFAPRPSLPSLHTLAQSDFVYPIKARKGTLGARLPLEPWDVGAEPGPESPSEEAPSLQGLDRATDRPHLSHSPPVSEPYFDGNEDIQTGDVHADTPHAWTSKDMQALDGETPFLQPPISFELGPEEGPHMFASLFDVLSRFSSSSLSRSSSSSSSSSSIPVLSPDTQTQYGGDSPSLSPNRTSSEESVLPDLSFDDDITYLSSNSFKHGDQRSPSIDFLAMPGSFSTAGNFQPGTSVGTIRPPVRSVAPDGIDGVSTPPDEDWPSIYEDYATPEFDGGDIFDEHLEDVEEIVDSGGQGDRNSRRDENSEGRQSSNGYGNGGQEWRQVSAGGSYSNGHNSSGGDRRGGGSDDHRKDERDWRVPSAFSTSSDTESEESEEEGTQHPTQQSRPDELGNVSTSGDDDVPLAQRIPTALRAQRTILKQVRDEKDERRRLRALQRQRQQASNQTSRDEEPRHHSQIGPAPQQGPNHPTPSSSYTTRPRTKTLPSNTTRPILAEDLARRLRDVQELNTLPTPLLNKQQHSPSDSLSHSSHLRQRSVDARVPNVGVQDRSLQHMRSFHRPSRVADAAREQPMPMPPLAHDDHLLGRRATTASRPVKQHDRSESSHRASPSLQHRSIRRPQTSDGARQPAAVPFHPSVFQQVTAPHTPSDVPAPVTQAAPRDTKQVSWQQRVFIVDLQRFFTLIMSPMTTAKDVLDTLEVQGQLANWAGVGGWMLFEVSQDFGMERPIRNFEVVSDVINSWDKDKGVNLLVARKTPLATLLHPFVMPSSSPVLSTYVEWESKPRKWCKRWLELREQGLWLSKKDNGKDETFLCSLANFDAYVVTRIHKSPKPYVFAVKSTDNLSLFENKLDYVHVFCCSEKDGKKWLESLLLARSYIINQERNTLSVGAPSASSGASGKTLSRMGTRKGTRPAQQPLVNVSAPAAAMPNSPFVFEPGSLLAKR